MANEQNLTEAGRGWTREEQSKGGRVSGEKRRLRAAVEHQLELKVPPRGVKGVQKMLKDMGIDEDHHLYGDAIAAAMIKKAMMGDVSAATWVRDTVGEKPRDKTEVEYGPHTRDVLEGLSLEQKLAMIDDIKMKLGGSK